MNPLTPITSIMSTDLITVMPSTPLPEARDLFARHNIHHLPVKSAAGELVGLLSHSDFIKLAYEYATEVKDLMTTKLAKLEADDTVRTAANLFLINRFHALPVVSGQELLGIVTVLDLVRLMDSEVVELGDYAGGVRQTLLRLTDYLSHLSPTKKANPCLGIGFSSKYFSEATYASSSAAAPPTISRISLVIASWRALL